MPAKIDKGHREAGDKIRRRVLGHAHVDLANKNTIEFDRPFQEFITEGAWGRVWARPGLTLRERSLITLALLSALGHDEEVAMHIRACVNTGASKEDIMESFLHVAVYAGVPAANRAIRIAKATFTEMDNGRDET